MRFTIVHLNDTHAYMDIHQEMFWQGDRTVYRPAGGYARIASLVKKIRAESHGLTLFCDCEDTFHGTYPALKTQGQALIPILNSLGLDAMTAHWEFAYGPKIFQQRVTELNYPMLAINIYNKETGKLSYLPYVVKEVGGLRIMLIGIASNIVDKTMPPSFSEGLRFTLQSILRSLERRLRYFISRTVFLFYLTLSPSELVLSNNRNQAIIIRSFILAT